MGKYDTFKTYYGTSIADSMKVTTLNLINDSFTDSPFYKLLKINNIDVPCRVESTKKYNVRNLLFQSTNTNAIGDIVVFENNNWLITGYWTHDIMPKAEMCLCNQTLKWQDSNGITLSYPAYCTDSKYIFTTEENVRYGLSLATGSLYVYVSSDIFTQSIELGKRFILGSQVYKVTGFDDIEYEGIIQLTVALTEKNDIDNFTLGIADYVSYTYTIFINNGSTASISLGTTLPLSVEVKFGDEIITSPVVTYSSSAVSKATVSTLGVITPVALGSATITATAYGVSDTIAITITDAVIPDNYVISISGETNILQGASKEYTAVVTNNGTVVVEDVVWSITSGSTYAEIVSQDSDSCIVRNISVGSVVLQAVMVDDGTVLGSKNIVCKSLW